jgi:hypothetical protein
MQQKLILYIGNIGTNGVYTEANRVDQFKDESVSFTQTIQNVKDIKKIFTEFTKTFALPASPRNNKLFKHYYNFDISENNAFDARVKVDASLELNDILFKTGKIALTGVELKNNVPHTYKVTFYGSTVDLKDILGDNQLSSLTDLNDLNLDYNYTTVKDKIENTDYGDDIIVPLITHTARLTYSSANADRALNNLYYRNIFTDNGVVFSQFKYALRLQRIIEAIEAQFPITFSNDFFNDATNTDWDNLYMWLHRKKGDVTPAEQVDIIWTNVSELDTYSCTGNQGCVTFSTENNGVVTIGCGGAASWGGFYNLKQTTVGIYPGGGNTATYSARLLMIQNGQQNVVDSLVNVTGTQFMGNVSPTNQTGMFDCGAEYIIQITAPTGTPITIPANGIRWTIVYQDPFEQGPEYYYQYWKNQTPFTNSETIPFNIQEQIPKMKIIDFLTGVFQMFNLTAYVENDIIVVQPLDEFYNKAPQTIPPAGEEPEFIGIEIDKFLDVSKSTVDIALPFKEINFSYKGLKTFLAQQYEQLNNTGWGSLSYSANSYFDAPTEKYSIELPFEHVMFERLWNSSTNSTSTLMYGYFVDDNQEAYYGNPLIFYGFRRQPPLTSTSFSLKSTEAATPAEIDEYWIPMNTKEINPATSNTSLHFNNEIMEYNANIYADANQFTGTLFENNYKTYIQEVFNTRLRLTKVTAYLPYKIFNSLQLYDRIRFRQQNYKINSMTTNLTTGKTEFELLNSEL